MRLTGQDVSIQIIRDGTVVDTINSITFDRVEIAPEYLGETTPHPLGDLGKFTITMQAEPGQRAAWEAFTKRIAEQGRAQYLRALAVHILAGHWTGQMYVHDRGWFWWQVCRLEPTDDGRMIQRHLGCTFDNQADPTKGTWTRGPFPTPTLDELVGQLDRSEHPWVAMDVGASGFVDTICAPKAGPQ